MSLLLLFLEVVLVVVAAVGGWSLLFLLLWWGRLAARLEVSHGRGVCGVTCPPVQAEAILRNGFPAHGVAPTEHTYRALIKGVRPRCVCVCVRVLVLVRVCVCVCVCVCACVWTS